MNLQELKQEAYKLSVSDRLALIEALVQSLMNELETRLPVAKGTLTGLRGLLKTDAPPPSDEEVQVILEERVEEKCQ
ncbi:MAG TPA: hypothetical protein DCZ55_24300 [Cyanobacteria bacterium UBA11371]|nr:hypothetical protein [Cyanobacteria bacterium UBA11371]